MSNSRRYRRQANRWLWRTPGVELAAETRAWVARVKVAHDDPTVSVEEFAKVGRAWSDYMMGRSQAEQIEAGLEIHQYIVRQITGIPNLQAVAIEKPRAS